MPRTEQVLLFSFFVLSVLGMGTTYLLLDGIEYQQTDGLAAYRVWVPHSVDVERQQVLDRMEVQTFEIEKADAALLQALADFNLRQPALGGGSLPGGLVEATERYRGYVAGYIEAHGMERYFRLGLFTRGVFLNALDRVVRYENSKKGPEPSSGNKLDKHAIPTLEKLAGESVGWALQSGLIGTQSYGESFHLFMAGLFYKLRWLQWADGISPMGPFLSSFERQAILAYRVEFEPGLSFEERQKLLQQLHKLNPGFPVDVMRIVVLAKSGRAKDAQKLLDEALTVAPDNRLLLRLKQQVYQRIAAENTQSEEPAPNNTPPSTGRGDARPSKMDTTP